MTQELLRRIVQRNPLQVADAALEELEALESAQASALYAVEAKRIHLLHGRSTDRATMRWVEETWRLHAAPLADGQMLKMAARRLVPLKRGTLLRGLLYIDSENFAVEHVKSLSELLLDTIEQQHSSPTVSDILERLPMAEIEKQKIVLLCETHEWNLARVARAMKLSRLTIYHRLEAYGIERKKVSLSGRRKQ